jgi:hypothetical protein
MVELKTSIHVASLKRYQKQIHVTSLKSYQKRLSAIFSGFGFEPARMDQRFQLVEILETGKSGLQLFRNLKHI